VRLAATLEATTIVTAGCYAFQNTPAPSDTYLMHRHHAFAAFLLAVLPGVFLPGLVLANGAGVEDVTRPDVVVLMADDLDVPTFETALALDLLPTLRSEMVDGGMSFDSSFVTDALCCPSRATFLTGEYPHNHGVLKGTFPDGSFGAFDDSHTLATSLHDAGYRTGIIGKFLNGYGYTTPRNAPACTSADCRMHYISPGWSDWQAMPDYGELNGSPGYAGAYCMYNYTINDNGNLATYGTSASDYQTDVIAQRAAGLVDSAAQGTSPLFLYLAPLAPHYELCLPAADPFAYDVRPAPRYAGSLPPYVNLDVSKPSFNESDVSDKPPWFPTYYPTIDSSELATLNRQYRDRLETLRALDDLFAAVKQHLVSAGRWDNTYVVFTSDNGWLYGEHRTWGKVLAYEESIRVPLLIRGPAVPASAQRDALVLNNDLAATILELAGLPGDPRHDGRSLVPLFANPAPPAWRRRFLIEHFRDPAPSPVYFYDYLGVRTAAGDFENTGSQTLIDWRVDWRTDQSPAGFEHYDLVADPYQLDSLNTAGSAAQRAALLADIALLRDCGKPAHTPCIDAERVQEHLFYSGFE
jgi:arylsulfatase A-like enzyme